jgi:redox-sensitive bicupin YhaK (pirin superfamily)
MSGPVTTDDVLPAPEAPAGATGPVVELEPGRVAQVGTLSVRRVLPHRPRRTVGAWCFADHVGPVAVPEAGPVGIGPHPHLGLQTVTWLVSGALLHLDSLGSEQLIRPGQLNLMTAGHGVAHAEEDPGASAELHAVQLWVAQPDATRNGAPAFEHHAELPRVDLGGGEATVLLGDFAGLTSPARRDTEHMGAELRVRRGTTVVPLRGDYEHALVVLEGSIQVDGRGIEPGVLGYLGAGRTEGALVTDAPARALLLGGLPLPEPILMWWNFVGRSRDELSDARRQWSSDDGRFGTVRSTLERVEVGPAPWE